MAKTHKITPNFWFVDKAEAAAKYYVDTFNKNPAASLKSKITNTTYYPEATKVVSSIPAGSVLTIEFELEGQPFVILNGGKLPNFELNGAVSFIVNCRDQAEVDYFWKKLSAVPAAEQCGWCTDKFGVTWQIVPAILAELFNDKDQAKVERVTAAFLPMKKLDIAKIKQAAKG